MINIYSHRITGQQLKDELMNTAQGDTDEIHNAAIVLCDIVERQQAQIDSLTKQVGQLVSALKSARIEDVMSVKTYKRIAYEAAMSTIDVANSMINRLTYERDAAFASIAELEATTVLTPRKCNRECFERGWQAAIEAAAKLLSEQSLTNPLVSDEWLKHSNDRDEQVAFTHADRCAVAIRAITPPDCDCNPLAPDAKP